MRSFVDADGRQWQAALLDASFGSIALIFSPLHGGAIHRRHLAASHMAEAMAMVAALDADGLRVMLREADPWNPGADGA